MDVAALCHQWTTWLFWLLLAFGVRVVASSHRSSYPLRWLVVSHETKLIDLHKVFAFGGWLAALWAFIYAAQTHAMPEWLFVVFFLGCTAPRLLEKFLDLKRGSPPTSPSGSAGNQ